MDTNKIKKIHMVGIGGAGMSALAQYYQYHGITITGSDLSESENILLLRKKYQIAITIGSNPNTINENYDALIYSPAIPEHDPERQQARHCNIPQFSYPEALGFITEQQKTIAISGTNGKTTTTSMLIELLDTLNVSPTGVVGAQLQKFNSNFIPGNSEYLIAEACEYKRSFLNIHHDILVITNITEDHLDYFTDLADIQKAFCEVLENKKGAGILVCNTELVELESIIQTAEKIGMQIIPYQKYLTEPIKLSIPGKHNQQNAAAALAVIEALDLDIGQAKDYLAKEFKGAKRRMEYIGETKNGSMIFDDYAHNPEGLRYLISGLRDYYPDKKIIILFEPHLYSRTRDFKNEFARALELADILYLFPTYRAREEEIPQENYLLEQYIDTSKVEMMTVIDPEKFADQFNAMQFGSDYLVVSAGAGDIWKTTQTIKK